MTEALMIAPDPPPANRRSDRQAQIFDAAMALFEARGYEGVGVEEICAAAGVARATFFRLFGGKAGLIEEANRRTAWRVRTRIEADGVRGRLALRLMGETIGAAWLEAGAPVYAMFEAFAGKAHAIAGMGEPGIDASYQGSRALAGLAITYVAQGQADGDFRSELDPEAMGLGFMNLIITACSVWVDRDARSPAAFPGRLDQAVSVVLRGLAASPRD